MAVAPWILKARGFALAIARFIRAWLSAIILLVGALVATYFAEPVIRRGVDLSQYILNDRQAPLPADERLVDGLEHLYGKPTASNMSTLIMLGAVPLEPRDEAATDEELDSIANAAPGGTLYWIPSAQNIEDSYGLMLATLFEVENGNYYKQRKIQEALDQFLRSAKQKAPSNRTLAERAANYISPTPRQSGREVNKNFRDSATLLKNALKDSPETTLVASDLRLYLALAGLDDKATITVPGLSQWLNGPHDPMEIIADGELEITVFTPAPASAAQAVSTNTPPQGATTQPTVGTVPSAPADKESITVSAKLYGRQSKFFEFVRPKWFKDIHIKKARELANGSQALAPFFGITGGLRAVPFGIWVEKEPLYEIQVAPADQEKVAVALALPNASVTVEFPGGRILAPGAQATRINATNWWQLVPPDARAHIVAVVSQRH
jgi:hypothetical protein